MLIKLRVQKHLHIRNFERFHRFLKPILTIKCLHDEPNFIDNISKSVLKRVVLIMILCFLLSFSAPSRKYRDTDSRH